MLKPRDTYYGEDYAKNLFEDLHIIYREVKKTIVRKNLATRERANKGTKPPEIQVGDLVFLYNKSRANKTQKKWLENYVVTQQRAPHTFILFNQYTNQTLQCHARHLRKVTHFSQWEGSERELPEGTTRRRNPTRRVRLAAHSSPWNSSDDEPLADKSRNLRPRVARTNNSLSSAFLISGATPIQISTEIIQQDISLSAIPPILEPSEQRNDISTLLITLGNLIKK